MLMRDLNQRETFADWPEMKAHRKEAQSMVTVIVSGAPS